MTAEREAHPAVSLDDTVHQRVRLGILAILSEATECSFAVLRDELRLTDGNLNRHLAVLERAQLLRVRKGYEGRRPCTWLRLTRRGREALRDEIAALDQIVTRLRGSAAAPAAGAQQDDPAGPPAAGGGMTR
jgi:DNA-binding MarR family transcriptional regulator